VGHPDVNPFSNPVGKQLTKSMIKLAINVSREIFAIKPIT
jgi:hypothetical protein